MEFPDQLVVRPGESDPQRLSFEGEAGGVHTTDNFGYVTHEAWRKKGRGSACSEALGWAGEAGGREREDNAGLVRVEWWVEQCATAVEEQEKARWRRSIYRSIIKSRGRIQQGPHSRQRVAVRLGSGQLPLQTGFEPSERPD